MYSLYQGIVQISQDLDFKVKRDHEYVCQFWLRLAKGPLYGITVKCTIIILNIAVMHKTLSRL